MPSGQRSSPVDRPFRRRAIGAGPAALYPSGRIVTRGAFLRVNRSARRNEARGILLHPSANAILTRGDWPKAIRNPGGRIRMALLRGVWCVLRLLLLSHSRLVLENLALRQQLAILRRSVRRPSLRPWDRLFWVWLSRCWAGWKDALAIVAPATVVGWHRQGFRLYWRWKSRGRAGTAAHRSRSPPTHPPHEPGEPLWGAPRIQAELRLLGHDVAESTVAKYMVRRTRPPSPTWRSFLANHVGLPGLGRFLRRAHGHVPAALRFRGAVPRPAPRGPLQRDNAPDGAVGARQIREAFPFDEAPRYLIRDRDGAYGEMLSGMPEAVWGSRKC